MSKKSECIEMSVGGLTLDPVTKTPIVILKDSENKLNLPIWMACWRRTAMATEIEGITMARPMTHDLLKTLLGEVGCSVQSIEITELKENTYYAAINLTLARRAPAHARLAPQRCHRIGATRQMSNLCRQGGAGSIERLTAGRKPKTCRLRTSPTCPRKNGARFSKK